MITEELTLLECCEHITDGDHQAPPKSEMGVPFVTISNINSYNEIDFSDTLFVPQNYYDSLSDSKKPQRHDILYSVVGSFGIPVLVKESKQFCFQRHIALLRPNHYVDARFLYYVLKSPAFYAQADAIALGAAQRTISLSALRNMRISLPPFERQKNIAQVLSAYDNLIENNRRQIKLLEEAAQRLYKEWFVDLRFPGWETTPIVDGVPEGWTTTIIDKVCKTIGGGTPSTKVNEYYLDGTIKWVTPTDVTRTDSLVLLDTEKKITETGLRNSSAKMLPAYTILMTSRASVGFFGMCDQPVCTNQGFISCIPYALAPSRCYNYAESSPAGGEAANATMPG